MYFSNYNLYNLFGVRQEGLLSSYLFAIDIDDLSVELNKLQAGCCIGNNLINHILLAGG